MGNEQYENKCQKPKPHIGIMPRAGKCLHCGHTAEGGSLETSRQVAA